MSPSAQHDRTARTALVAAGTMGIGYAIAERLVSNGFDTVVSGRDQARLAAAVASLKSVSGDARVFGLRSDLTCAAETEELFQNAAALTGGVDCLIVNSGHMPYGTLDTLTDEAWFTAFEMILMSAVRLARRAVPHMKERGFGDIVFITGAEAREPSPQLVLASSFRAAIANLAKIVGKDVASHDIRVNVVAPGYFDTGRVRARIDAIASERQIPREDALKLVVGENPLGRAGDAREIGELVWFICSRKAAFLNGTTIVIDGGKSASVI